MMVAKKLLQVFLLINVAFGCIILIITSPGTKSETLLRSPFKLLSNLIGQTDESEEDTGISCDYLTPIQGPCPDFPHFIHQTWIDKDIPSHFKTGVESWIRHHPPLRWKYIFWTDEGARKLMKKHFPDSYLPYNNFRFKISKADAARVAILLVYGGVYADLDVEALQPLDNYVCRRQCFLAGDQPLHTPQYDTVQAINALMGCGSNHTYFRHYLAAMRNFSVYASRDVQEASGPALMNKVLRTYRADGGSAVTVAAPESFMPKLDPQATLDCSDPTKLASMFSLQQTSCQRLSSTRRRTFRPGNCSLTDHTWAHTYWGRDRIALEREGKVNILSLVPHAIVDPWEWEGT